MMKKIISLMMSFLLIFENLFAENNGEKIIEKKNGKIIEKVIIPRVEIIMYDDSIKKLLMNGYYFEEIRLGNNPVRTIEKNTVRGLEEELEKGKEIFVLNGSVIAFVNDRNGKWYLGRINGPRILIGKYYYEDDSTIIFIPERIGLCWNSVKGFRVKISPSKIIEKEIIVKEDPIWEKIILFGSGIVTGIIFFLLIKKYNSEKDNGAPPTVITE